MEKEERKNKKRHEFEVFLQIFLLVGAIFSFGYIAGEVFGDSVGEIGIVSAQSEEDIARGQEEFQGSDVEGQLDSLGNANDVDSVVQGAQHANIVLEIIDRFIPGLGSGLSGGVGGGSNPFSQFLGEDGQAAYTCPQAKDGGICQEFLTNECEDECNVPCLENTRANLPDDSICSVGTCIDREEGICSSKSTKDKCEEDGGFWEDKPQADIPECRKGCCLIAEEARFLTEGQCVKFGESNGLILGEGFEYRGDINDELVCFASAKANIEGACTFDIEGEKDGCKFTTLGECTSIGGEFNEKILCSNEKLNGGIGTICERQVNATCVDGKDEIYWFDSCGNRENIYSSDKDASWNSGEIVGKEDSCSLGVGENLKDAQGTCGNCNRILGSVCSSSKELEDEKLDDESIEFVCKDLSCDDNGVHRENGESWCAYQSSIGVDSLGLGLGIDIPGLDLVEAIG